MKTKLVIDILAKECPRIFVQVEYTKDGEAARHQFTLPTDIPELNRAKESARNASDVSHKFGLFAV